ncbi:uncharacterized protein JN550_005379 [Neoarthrinium moseri]|uniref:uncharacterized protein n=1 Tax=Neoarthrinium moseri TaxID=1658444 RepID=UPI001FDE05FD|nr:uncharacterized protein JN550_005379 [Neoarthrinium moseri]KAI1870451.1 hypothetical protein JN550_005379 [Neoarthrinium moseri]
MVAEAEKGELFLLDEELAAEEYRKENPQPNDSLREIYDDGVRLFTKEGIQDLERQLAKVPQPTAFRLRSLTGRMVTSDEKGALDSQPMFCELMIGFKMYQDFFWSAKSQNTLQYACPLHVAVIGGRELTADINPQRLQKFYQEQKKGWDASTKCTELKQKLIEAHIPQNINKIICFGLGTLTNDLACDEVNPEGHAFRATTQHATAVTMAEIMRHKFGHAIKLLAQDPAYDSSSKHCIHLGPIMRGPPTVLDVPVRAQTFHCHTD